MEAENACNHRFVATPEKGVWTVKVRSTNNRGKPEDERVTTTVFECGYCGARTEYPDTWERTFIAPKEAGRIVEMKRKKNGYRVSGSGSRVKDKSGKRKKMKGRQTAEGRRQRGKE